MQQRLMRTRHDKVVAGVCGGLADYFELDPTIVRLVMLLISVVLIGLGLYPILWLLMPIELEHPAEQPGSVSGAGWMPPVSYDPRMHTPPTPVQHPRPYRFDPQTGQPLSQDAGQAAYTGTTVQYASEPAAQDQSIPDATVPPHQRERRPVLGVMLVAVGVFAIAQQLDMDWLLPIVLIVMGMLLLMRNR